MNEVAAAVISSIEEAYTVCVENAGRPQSLTEAWAPLDALFGKEVTALRQSAEISGIAGGIDESGALLLQLPGGGIEAIHAGDVTLKK